MQNRAIETVLVTGANGFIGSRLCRRLAADGFAVRILCRESSDLTLLKDIPVTKIIGDITNPGSLPQAVSGVDYIVHLAGLIRARKVSDFYFVNQQGTANLAEAVKNHNPGLKKFVLISSLAAAGPASVTPRKESDPPHPITDYGQSKLAGEEALKPYFNTFPITIIRPPAVYGPGDKAILTIFQLVNRRLRAYMAGGHNRVQMVFVDDLVEGIIQGMDPAKGRNDTFFIAQTESNTVREMMDIIAELLNKKTVPLTVPMPLLKIIALISESFFKMIGKAPLFSRQKVRELTADWAIDVSLAQEKLGFTAAHDFRTGARITIDWYRREGWLK